jgi:hypothetical protein
MSTPHAPTKPVQEEAERAPSAASPPSSGSQRHPLHEAGGAAGGAIAGAALGAVGGPAGAAAGAIIGGVVGAFVTKIADEEAARASFHDGELDEEIGVSGGDIGAPNLKHPPAKRGTYSAAAAGGSGSDGSAAEGPMQTPED